MRCTWRQTFDDPTENENHEANMEKFKVRAGKYKVGDIYKSSNKEWEITGLGQVFTQYVPDEDACCYGLMPGRDYRLQMQYIYTKPL